MNSMALMNADNTYSSEARAPRLLFEALEGVPRELGRFCLTGSCLIGILVTFRVLWPVETLPACVRVVGVPFGILLVSETQRRTRNKDKQRVINSKL